MVQYLSYSIIRRFRRYSAIASQISPLTRFYHSNTASGNTRSRMRGFRPFSVTTSTFLPSKLSNSRINRTGNQGLRFSPKSIKKSTSLSASASPPASSYRTKNPHIPSAMFRRYLQDIFLLFFQQFVNLHRPIASISTLHAPLF